MKVYENLENYDIPQGFHLTAEEEEQFASDLKDIVKALVPIRDSKLKTRKFFNSHLRFNSNEKDAEPAEYEPLPGEYNWNSELLQPALRDILMPDHWSFGFVLNLITKDIAYRNNKRVFETNLYSDEIVKFALQFDIDDIRTAAKAIPDIKDRILFLNGKITDLKVFGGLSPDEQEWADNTVLPALQSLVEEAEKELKLEAYSKKSINVDIPQSNEQSTLFTAARLAILSKDILYDLTLCDHPKFAVLHRRFAGGFHSDKATNEFGFTSMLEEIFSNCYDSDNKLQRDKVIFENYPPFILALFDSYAKSIYSISSEDRRSGLRMICRWVAKTRTFIDSAHEAHSILYQNDSDGLPEFDKDGKETWPLKQALLSPIYLHFQRYAHRFVGDLSDTMYKVVPFNMWDERYDSLRHDYEGELGLEFEQRAVIYVRENTKLFYDTLVQQCVNYCFQTQGIDQALSSEDSVFMDCYKSMTSLLHKYFRDFIKRAQSVSNNAKEIDNAILHWLFSLQSEVYNCYTNNSNTIRKKCGWNLTVSKSMMRFFYDICEKNIFDMVMEYFLDTEEIPLVKEVSPQPGSPEQPAQEPQQPAQEENEEDEEEEPTPLHNKNIDYHKLYEYLSDIAFPNTTEEEFKEAIDKAEFGTIMDRCKNGGHRSGYTGALKFVIKHLGVHLGANWYDIACSSIGEDTDAVNRLNTTTKQINKIKPYFFSDCISKR